MTINFVISIREPDVANDWLEMVKGINEDYRIAMKDAADSLTDMQNFAEGTLVDEFVKYGTDLLNAAETTFNAISTISDTVTSILGSVGKLTQDVVSGIVSTVGKVFGK